MIAVIQARKFQNQFQERLNSKDPSKYRKEFLYFNKMLLQTSRDMKIDSCCQLLMIFANLSELDIPQLTICQCPQNDNIQIKTEDWEQLKGKDDGSCPLIHE